MESNADDDIPAWVRDELWRKANAIAPWVKAATKPLVSVEGKRVPRLVGGSVLINAGGHFLLLTADHVIAEFVGGPINVMSPPTFAPVNGQIYRAVSAVRGADVDAAVVDIDPKFVTDEMRESAISSQLLAPLDHRRSRIMQLIGYPASRYERVNGMNVVPDWLQWTGTTLTDDELVERGHDMLLHFGFDFEPKRSVDAEGNRRQSPAMAGVSGSGMWLLPPIGQTHIGGKQARLAAIFTEQRPPKRPTYMLGTWVGVHVELIMKNRPALARFF